MQMPGKDQQDAGTITEKKDLIGAMTKLYSDELKKDLAEILGSDLQSVGDLEKASTRLLKAYKKVSAFVEFQDTFEGLL